MSKLKKIGLLGLLCFTITWATASDKEVLSQDLIERSNQVITQLSEKAQTDKIESAFSLMLIQKYMSPVIDYNRLTKKSMGKYWKKTEENLKRQIEKQFMHLLENTYAKILSQYRDEKVKLIDSRSLPGDKISVKLEIIGGSQAAEVEYVYGLSADNQFKIEDIKVEGVSLVTNYRRQFKSILKKEGAQGLVDKLEQLAAKKLN